jgi:hypothetical protein
MLEALEMRLAATDRAFPAIVFYHLRGLWQLGRELITHLVADLVRQNEDRERKLHIAEFNRRQFAKRQAVEAQVRDAEAQCAADRERVLTLEQRRAGLTRFWHYFRRRELDADLIYARRSLEASTAALRDSRDAVAALDATAAGEFPGLSIEARRAINLAGIAYAELLCLRLARTPLVRLAREAMGRREATDDYGSRADCEALIADIDRARVLLQQRTNLPEEIRGRLERLRKLVRYRAPEDTTPVPDTVLAEGAATPGLPNVLAEDTFDLFRIVLR